MATVVMESLDKKVTDRDVNKLAEFMTEWEAMRVPLGLDHAKKRVIKEEKDYEEQKRECIEQWRTQEGDKATYCAFIKAAREAKMNGLADEVVAMLRERETSAEGRFTGTPVYVAKQYLSLASFPVTTSKTVMSLSIGRWSLETKLSHTYVCWSPFPMKGTGN